MPRLSAVDEDGDASPLHHRAPPPPLASNLEHVEAPVDPTSAFKHAALADFDEALASFASSEMFRMCDVGDPWTTNDMDLSASSGQTRVDSPVYGRLGECVETDDNNPLSLPHPPHPRYGHADSLVVPTDGKPWWSDPREGAAEVSLNATPSINPGLFTLTPAQRHQLQARQHNAYPPPRPPAPPARKRASRAADTPKRKRELGAKGFGEQKRGTRTTSKYRGVTHHCRTGRWEAHIWEDGKQVYLGGFDSEQQAALAYDVAAIKCRGEEASTNFDMNDYAQELAALDAVNKEELVLSLRRQSKGFVKGSSKFRGVTRHQKGRWEARIGQLVGRKYRYLGLYDREEEAAVAYDTEAVRQKGFDAVTNFDLSEYADVLAEHHAARRARRTLSHPTPEPPDPTAPPALPATSIKQRLKAASESGRGGMLEGPAAEREPRGEAVDAVRAFFRDGPGGRSLVALDPVGEVATSAGNAAAAVVAAREARGARTTVWAPMDQAQVGSLREDEVGEADVLDAGAGAGGEATIQALRAMVREARTQLASTQKQLEVAMIGGDEGGEGNGGGDGGR